LKLKILIVLFLFVGKSLLADEVVLKNGKVYENVKANLLRSVIQFTFEEKLLTFKKSDVKRIRLRPVILKPPTNEVERLAYEAERIRVAEALQNNTDWEMTSNSKQSVAVIKLLPGSGVSLAEVESVTNLIRTSLVKTKLFVIIDTTSLESSAKQSECPPNKKDCAPKLPENVKVNKLVTGTLTRLGNKYLINGTVLDGKENKVVFAEKAAATSQDKLEEASEYFAKKVAGGLMEDWNEALTAKENETYANLQYVWRSSLIPGLGQWKYGKDKEDSSSVKKGFAFGAVTAVLLINVIYHVQKLSSARESYDSNHRFFFLTPSGSGLELIALNADNQSFANWQNVSNTTKLSAYALIGFYLYNVIDAFFLGKPFFSRKESTSGIFILPSKYTYSNGLRENYYTIGMQFQF